MDNELPEEMYDSFCVAVHTGLEAAIATLIEETGEVCIRNGIPRKRIFGVLMAAIAGQLFDTCNMQIGHGLGLEEPKMPETINIKRMDMIQRQALHCVMAIARERYPETAKQFMEVASRHAHQGLVDGFNEDIKRSMT